MKSSAIWLRAALGVSLVWGAYDLCAHGPDLLRSPAPEPYPTPLVTAAPIAARPVGYQTYQTALPPAPARSLTPQIVPPAAPAQPTYAPTPTAPSTSYGLADGTLAVPPAPRLAPPPATYRPAAVAAAAAPPSQAPARSEPPPHHPLNVDLSKVNTINTAVGPDGTVYGYYRPSPGADFVPFRQPPGKDRIPLAAAPAPQGQSGADISAHSHGSLSDVVDGPTVVVR